ncbi:TIM barrel protein [Bacteroidales bacterium OttesenSCG-928-I14]|nr:TIM barrel protein [Bacteroidales bacterium OttesenSCG-928-I14]
MIKFGVAGYPIAFDKTEYRKDKLNIFKWLSSIGLDAFEMQMTYGPRTKEDTCKDMRLMAADFGIKITVHASYYIVFTSSEKDKIGRSKETLKRTYELADLLGSDVIVLHPGPLYKEKEETVTERFLNNVSDFFNEFRHDNIGLFLETAGKKGQLGSVEEIIQLSKAIKGCYPCFDFGHIHARTVGSLNSEKNIEQLFDTMKDLGAFTSRYHIHYTPIDYTSQGEKVHKAINDIYPTNEQMSLFDDNVNIGHYHPRYEPIIKSLIDINANCTVISETHNSQEEGALAMKDYYLNLKK